MKNSTSFLFCRLRRQLHILKHWSTRLVTIIVVLELGVLSPLSCVLHCLIWQWMYEQASPNFFFCDLRHDGTITDDAAPIATVHPRAVYEALPPLWVAVLLVVPLILLLASHHPVLRRISPLPPPTPPPRMFSLRLLFASLPVTNVKAASAMQQWLAHFAQGGQYESHHRVDVHARVDRALDCLWRQSECGEFVFVSGERNVAGSIDRYFHFL